MRRSQKARAAVLDALSGGEWTYGLDAMRAAHLRAGRFYPSIWHLEQAGIVESCWEESEPNEVRRRRLWRWRAPEGTVRRGRQLVALRRHTIGDAGAHDPTRDEPGHAPVEAPEPLGER